MLETLDYTIRIGSIPTFLYFDLHFISIGFSVSVYLVLFLSFEFPVMGNLKRFKIIKMVVICTSAVITVYYMTIL